MIRPIKQKICSEINYNVVLQIHFLIHITSLQEASKNSEPPNFLTFYIKCVSIVIEILSS